MSLIVNSNLSSVTAQRHLAVSRAGMNTAMERLSSGVRINSAMDDSAGLAISNKLNALTASMQVAMRNISDGLSLAHTAEGAVRSIDDYLIRAKELITQAQNDTLTVAAKESILQELNQNFFGIAEVAATSKFNGINLLTNPNVSVGGSNYSTYEAAGITITSAPSSSTLSKASMTNIIGINGTYRLRESVDYDTSTTYYETEDASSWGTTSSIKTTVPDFAPRFSSDGSKLFFDNTRDGSTVATYEIDPTANPVSGNAVVAGSTQGSIQDNAHYYGGSSNGTFRYDVRLVNGQLSFRDNNGSGWFTPVGGTYGYQSLSLASDTQNDYFYTYTWYGSDAQGSTTGLKQAALSPTVSAGGIVQLAYTDVYGNIQLADVNLNNGTVSNHRIAISTDDVRGLDVTDDTISLGLGNNVTAPDLYHMNTVDASFSINKQRVSDGNSRELYYWNGVDAVTNNGNGTYTIGSDTVTGYYSLNLTNQTATFYGDAIIGGETGDDAQDYYHIQWQRGNSSLTNEAATASYAAATIVSVPGNVDLYNLLNSDHPAGSDKPRSLEIIVGGHTVTKAELLDARPAANFNGDGVWVDTANEKVYFYGLLRPNESETVTIRYYNDDVDGDNVNDEFRVNLNQTSIDTYNLQEPLNATGAQYERLLRVYTTDGTEVPYDATGINGYQYVDGDVILYGDYLPDPHDNGNVRIEYWDDVNQAFQGEDALNTAFSSNTTFSIRLDQGSVPIEYNLDDDDTVAGIPNSMRVYVGGALVEHDATNGWTFETYDDNGTTRYAIELHGTARPDVSDNRVDVVWIPKIAGASYDDSKVAIDVGATLSQAFVYSLTDANAPETFEVKVNGVRVDYDPSHANGYDYNPVTGDIELYGNARPDAAIESNEFYNRSYDDFIVEIRALDPLTGVSSDPTDLSTYGQSESYIVNLTMTPAAGYSFADPANDPSSLVVKYDGTYVPHDATNGWTYETGTGYGTHGSVVFHGSYRPSLDVDGNGVFVRDPSKYTIDIIQDVSVSIPANQIISEVTYGGTAIPLASLNGGNGYEINNDVVSLVGTARPTGDDASGSQLRVNYFSNPGEITLDTEQGNTIPQEILDFMPHLLSGTRKEDIRVYLGADKATAVTNGALTLDQFTYVGNKVTVNWDKVTLPGANTKVFVDYDVYPPNRADDNVFALQVGVSQAESDTLHLTIQAYENLILDLYSAPVPDVDNLDQWESRIQKAIEFSMKQGVSIGATSNRLEFAMESLMVTNENTVEAKSRIVDADYAVESAQLARNQLLQQAGTAMLAQANASSVSVLSLLR